MLVKDIRIHICTTTLLQRGMSSCKALIFSFILSRRLCTQMQILLVRIENSKAGNQISKLLTRAKYEPSLTDCGPLPHEISLLMLIHEFVSLHQQIPTQRPFARNPNIIRNDECTNDEIRNSHF